MLVLYEDFRLKRPPTHCLNIAFRLKFVYFVRKQACKPRNVPRAKMKTKGNTQCRAAERIWGPQVRMQHGPPCKKNSERYAKGVRARQRRTHLGGLGACSSRKILKIKVARIAMVVISASRYNYHNFEQASHRAQELWYNNHNKIITI